MFIWSLLVSLGNLQEQEVAGQGGEMPDFRNNCNSIQFYDKTKLRCRNCTELLRTFQPNLDWVDQEVDATGKAAPGSPGSRQAQKLSVISANNNKDQLWPAEVNLNARDRADVLSRLISVADQQDQELIDQELANSGSIEFSDVSADTLKMMRQTQKLIDHFIRSSYIENELLNTIDQCRRYDNISACQMWSNLCVMTIYSHSDKPLSTQSLSVPLNQNLEFSELNLGGESAGKSWTRCRQFTYESICNSLRESFKSERKSNAELQYIFASNDEPSAKTGSSLVFKPNQPIQLLAYSYSLEGNLLGIDQFGLDDMEKFCLIASGHRGHDLHGSRSVRLGQNARVRCQFDGRKADQFAVKNFTETVFIDLYLGYSVNGATFVKPVPILIENLIYNGQEVNRKYINEPSRWKLVHRFFFHSVLNFDGQQKSPESMPHVKAKYEDTILYAKRAVLDLKFKRHERGALLSSILLTLDYAHISRSMGTDNGSTLDQEPLESQVTIVQTLIDMQDYKRDLELLLTIVSVLSGVWSLIRCYSVQKCYGIVRLDLNSLFRFIVIGCDVVANLYAVVVFLCLGYIYLMIKFQSTVQMLAPGEEFERTILTFLQIVFICKLVGFAHKIFVHLNIDIFFVDWEKPKMLTSGQIISNHFANTKSQADKTSSVKLGNLNSSQNISNLETLGQQTSFWRPYSVINRWLQMQTKRRQSLTLQLMLFVALLELSRVVFIANEDSNWSDVIRENITRNQWQNSTVNLLNPNTSATLRLLVLAFVYLVLSMSQILYKRHLYEPMIRNRAHDFVDLCSVANVSLFCMFYPRFGYYIHGRNANGSGDCGLAEMNALLEREEQDLCSKRGLEPDSDQQTFVLVLPKIINDHYKKLLVGDNMPRVGAPSDQMQQFSLQLSSSDRKFDHPSNKFTGNKLVRSVLSSPLSSQSNPAFTSNRAFIETIVARNKAINLFLANFLDHIYKDIDYSIRESRRFENLMFGFDFEEERLNASQSLSGSLNASFDGSLKAATLHSDHQDAFTSLLWLGLEFDLILMELLTVLVIDYWFELPLIATAAIVWILHGAFKIIYIALARQNLVDKAVLDEKFLLR